jgi:dihydropteroate synthase
MSLTPEIWGILNVTPDSFSDGGKFTEVDKALAQAQSMLSAGATVIDIGGESTRPGASQISSQEEIARIENILKELVAAGVVVSLDTMKSEVAEFGLNAGAKIINDVSGGLADSKMHEVVAKSDCDYVLMHWRGHSDVMNSLAKYDNVVLEVISEWSSQKEKAVAAGIKAERIIFDPGLGFAKESNHNWQLLAHLPELQAVGHRVLIGASRKRFLAPVSPLESVEARDIPTAQISGWCASHGIYAVRVHDVATSVSAINTIKEIKSNV